MNAHDSWKPESLLLEAQPKAMDHCLVVLKVIVVLFLAIGSGQLGEEKKVEVKMSDRRMKFPYTFSAKIAQFPLRFYLKNQWVWRYYFISLVACSPVFIAISRLANSPGNKAKWAEMKRKELAEHHH